MRNVIKWYSYGSCEFQLRIYMKNVHCKSADAIYELKGEKEEPIRDVFIENVKVDTVRQFVNRIEHVEGLHANDVSYGVIKN